MSESETNPETDSNGSDDEIPEAIFPGSGPNREEMISNYLPEQNDWEAKTILDLSDPAAIAALSNMERMFPEVDDLQPLIDDFLFQFLKSRTSVGGQSRDDFRKMFISMFGGTDDDGNQSKALKLVAADDD